MDTMTISMNVLPNEFHAHAPSVSRALTAAGLTRSEFHGSKQVRGYGNYTEGFAVEAEKEYSEKRYVKSGRIFVDYNFASWGRATEDEQQRTARREAVLDRAAEALKAKGYKVAWTELGGESKRPALVVSKEPVEREIEVTLTVAEVKALHNHTLGSVLVSAQDKLRAALDANGEDWS